ncbi:MAG: hypothetical protein AWU57_484 [Marinobacter sp. T13-3]|nr:MAG: hypothetical protein AWU57_484 [Marinobacter sp. T13-3]
MAHPERPIGTSEGSLFTPCDLGWDTGANEYVWPLPLLPNHKEDEELMLQHYGGDNDDAPFWREVNAAREWVEDQDSGWPFWVAVAGIEYAINANLLHLEPKGPMWDMDDAIQWQHAHRHKTVRHIRHAAKIEAVSGIDLSFHFYSEFARYIYPKLLQRIKANIEQATPNHPPARSSSCM